MNPCRCGYLGEGGRECGRAPRCGDDYRNRIVVIDPATDNIVWQYGITDQSGTTPGMLSIPDGFDNLLGNGTTPTHPLTG